MNIDKLKGKIKENRFNYDTLAKKLNIGYSTVKAKVNGKSAFNQPEMAQKLLIFFSKCKV